MLARIVELSIKRRAVVLAIACIVTGYGVFTAVTSKFDVYPEFAPPQVMIQTEAPGLSAEEVEELVTRPVENALNGTPGLSSIRSQSIQGLSVVTTIFSDGTDVFRARQMVGERLTEAASRLPSGVLPPVMAPLTGATSLVLIIGFTSDKLSSMDLRTFADWTVRPRLLGVPGVAKVASFGGEVKEIQVQVLPERLIAYGLSMDDVLAASRAATAVRGAGFVENSSQRIVLQTMGQALTAKDLGSAVLLHAGEMSVRLADVAHVVEAPEPKIGDAAINGKPGVMLEISSQYGSNTLEVTAQLENALEELKPALAASGIEMQSRLFRPASFIQRSIRNMRSSLFAGGLLVAAVLFIFLFNLRGALISLTAIPLSLLVAIIALNRAGQSLNTLTLGGLAIAIGEVVDDAIIDVENIFRRLRENQALGNPRSVFRVVLEASLEVRSAVVYATFVVVMVFLPVLTMSGIQGKLFAPLGWTYILAVLASLLVALTVTPALCYFLLPQLARTSGEAGFVTLLKRNYRRLLEGVCERPGLVTGFSAFVLLATAISIPFLGGSFLPDLREGHFIVHMSTIPGTSLQESLRIGRSVARDLLANRQVASVAQQIGRAELADDTWGTHYSEFHVALKPEAGEKIEEVESQIRQSLLNYPGISFAIRPFLAERIEEVISGVTAEVVIKVFGEDQDTMDEKVRDIAKVVMALRGAADVQVESAPAVPRMMIRLRPDRLRQFGFQTLPVLETIQTAYQGTPVAQAYEANRVFNVTVVLDPERRRNPEDVESLPLRNAEENHSRNSQSVHFGTLPNDLVNGHLMDPRHGGDLFLHILSGYHKERVDEVIVR